jgi:hypothetical protein
MGLVWLFFPHFARSVFGLTILMTGLPKSHEIIESMQVQDIEKATLETIQSDMHSGIQSYVDGKGKKLKRSAVFYTLLTFICYTFDCLCFLISFKYFGQEEHARAETILLAASLLYWLLDVSFFVWIARLKVRLPKPLELGIQNMLFGWGDAVVETSRPYLESAANRIGKKKSGAAAAEQV